ncbi:MAG: PfkB family carbohydrate kinase [Puniceicoccales bacterium]|nr:PfkB family carbohydrate kinase [Puniceicoccales bacterium]
MIMRCSRWETVLNKKRAWVGLDGFIDKLVSVVKRREGQGNQFEAYPTLTELGQCICEASGCNLNLELFPKCEKIGGNGPLLTGVLLAMGVNVHYVGTLGNPIHPLFETFAKKTRAISLGAPGMTQALECHDGKLLLGYTYPMDAVNYESLLRQKGAKHWMDEFSKSDLIAFQNWTMLYGMTHLLQTISDEWLPHLSPNDYRIWFFDLADPSKRTREDLQKLLQILPRFGYKGKVYLALNRSEAKIVGETIGIPCRSEIEGDRMDFQRWLFTLKEKLNVDCIVYHCHVGAVAVNQDETTFVPAFRAKQLRYLTGSGDHFNGGFLCGRLMNFDFEQSLLLGHSIAVLYIETGYMPSCENIQKYLSR